MKHLLLTLVTVWIAVAVGGDQRAVAEWPASCIHVTPETRAEAPMSDGQPDWKHVKVTGLVLDKNCYQYKVTR